MHIKQKKTQMMHNSQLSEIPLFLYTQKHRPPPLLTSDASYSTYQNPAPLSDAGLANQASY